MKTTLNLIRANDPHPSVLETLIESLPTGFYPDQELSLARIVESNGLYDAIWCLRATTTDSTQFSKQLAIACAEHVSPIFETAYPDDEPQRLAIQAARDYLAGDMSLDELNAAYADHASASATRATTDAYAYAAASAAYATAHASAYAAAGNATASAAYATARAVIAKIFLDMLKQTT